MEWFQQTDAEQKEKVNGCAELPEEESRGSDSCGGTSVSEATDLQELKTRESESDPEEDKEEWEAVPASKVQKSERTRKEKKSVDREEHKQNRSTASTYTGDLSRSASNSDAS